MEPNPSEVLERATSATVTNPEQAMVMLETLGKILGCILMGYWYGKTCLKLVKYTKQECDIGSLWVIIIEFEWIWSSNK